MQIVAIVSCVIGCYLGIVFLFATQIITGLSLSIVVSSTCLTACLEIRFINNSKSSNTFISRPLTATRSLLRGTKLILLQFLTRV
jgi:hypothetical protein